MLHAAAKVFSVTPHVESEGKTLLKGKVAHVFTPLKSTLVLLRQDGVTVAVLTSHFLTHYYRISNLFRIRVAETLGITKDQVLCFSSHNHCVVTLNHHRYSYGIVEEEAVCDEDELTWEGSEVLRGYVEAAEELKGRLVPVEVRYGKGSERRFTYNRKGRRADGTTYFMREEDRLSLGDDFTGDIDDDAFVIGCFDEEGKPVVFLSQFTGHPVTAFHCDHPVVHGEYPQIACDDLSEAFGEVPVAFLQGCAGDINSKGLLAATPVDENVKNAERYGHQLGETLISIAHHLQLSDSDQLDLRWRRVYLPFREVPPESELKERLRRVEDFLCRCDAGDIAATRCCDGLNFPSNMTISYRKALVVPIGRWLRWALDFHEKNLLHEAPIHATLNIAAVRIGDVGILGMPCEPLLGIGRMIKEGAPVPMAIPCGYMNDSSLAYVPDSPNSEDLDYVSAFYRYTTTLLPYQKPAGDLLASAGIALLGELFEK